MWKGVITSGLVVILVRLYLATESVSGHPSVPAASTWRRFASGPGGRWRKYVLWARQGYEMSFANFVVADESDLEKRPSQAPARSRSPSSCPGIQGALYLKAAYDESDQGERGEGHREHGTDGTVLRAAPAPPDDRPARGVHLSVGRMRRFAGVRIPTRLSGFWQGAIRCDRDEVGGQRFDCVAVPADTLWP